jgi:hypothetical protein
MLTVSLDDMVQWGLGGEKCMVHTRWAVVLFGGIDNRLDINSCGRRVVEDGGHSFCRVCMRCVSMVY